MRINRKSLGILLMVVGIIVLGIALTADVIGLGGNPEFGTKQIVGSIAGVVFAVIGLILLRFK